MRGTCDAAGWLVCAADRTRAVRRPGGCTLCAEVRFHFMTCGQDYYDMFTDRSLHTGIEMGRRATAAARLGWARLGRHWRALAEYSVWAVAARLALASDRSR